MNIKFLYILVFSIFAISCSSSDNETDDFSDDAPKEIPEEDSEEPDEEAPSLTDEELLDEVQEQTFNYFWDFAGTNSGLAKERSSDNNTVTTGGSGFGLASFPAAVERGWINRTEALQRLIKYLPISKI